MKPTPEYIAVEANSPFRGLATTPPSTRLDPSYSPNLMNVVVRDGVVRRRAGYFQLGRRLVGRVMAITEFAEIGQDPYLVVLTSHRQYAYNPATQDFKDLTPGQTSYAITAVNTGTKTFTIAGNHAANFPAARLIPVLGGANEDVYTVSSASNVGPNTEIIVVEAIPSAVVAGNIVIADDLDTDYANGATIEFASLTDTNSHRLLITNGSELPRVWDGDITSLFADWAPNFTNFVSCKTLAVFYDHLVLGGLELSTSEPVTVAWSDTGDFDEFELGNSGTQLLYGMKNGIKAMKLLGDRLAIYSYDAIMTATYIGGAGIFAFEVVVPEGTRLASPKSIVSINVGHIYASEENFYLFDGTRGLRVLGDAIYSDYKSRKDQALLYSSSSLNDFSKRTLFFAFPDINGGFIVYTAEFDVFDLSRIAWCREKYYHNPTAFGFFTNRDETLLWTDASWEPVDMPWSDEGGAWNEEAEQLEFPIRTFGTDNGEVFIVTEGVITDDERVQEQLYETPDFTVPEGFHSLHGRWAEVEFEGYGSEVVVSYSTNLGNTFTEIDTITLIGSPVSYRLPFDATGRTCRFRFYSAEDDFALRWIRAWVRPGAPR